MKLTFLGAAGEVTGSQHLIEARHRRLLLDCGFFQGPRAESRRKNERFRCEPKTLDAVILSHAHLDHCGNLPRLYKMGFRGPVFSTESTADVAELMLLDSARIQREDAVYLSRKLRGNHPPVEPLYTEDDVHGLMRLFEPCPFDEWHAIGKNNEIRLRFHPAGHILGSAITELELQDTGDRKRVVFTGDLGRRGMPLLRDPTLITEGADVVICESTYGNRLHSSPEDMQALLLQIMVETSRKNGKIVIPSFALGRTQQVVFHLNNLFNAGQLPRLPIYVDSPLATRLTKLFRAHSRELNADVQNVLKSDSDPFGFEQLTYIGSPQESAELNRRAGPFVVISASGMCESGRVVHHLKHSVSDPLNTVLLMGYQAPHTLGRQLAEHREYVRIFDHEQPLLAQVRQLDGLSAHADANDFKWWFEESTRHGHFGQLFLVHGEPESAQALGQLVRHCIDEEPVAPQYGESFEI